jgi:hypothetical protein
MIQRFLLVSILIVPLAVAAEGQDPAPGLTIGSLEATHSNGTVYRFPRIGGDSLAASRINTYLQTVELERPPGGGDASAFENVWPKDSHNGVTGLDYTLAFHQPGILSVSIQGWYYGAYESSIGRNHFFDARTGEVITLPSLFSTDGLAKLDAEITRNRLRRVDDFLAGKKLDGDTQLRSDPEEAEEQKALYRECRSSIERDHPVHTDAFTLERDFLELLREPCGPRVTRAIDELGFEDSRGFEQVAELLNDYGRCLLIARRTNCERQHSGVHAGVYRGKIGGRYPITLVVESAGSNGYVQASYFYDEQAKLIALRYAKAEDGALQLDERGSPPARFTLRAQPDGRLVGDWTQEGKPPQKVELR